MHSSPIQQSIHSTTQPPIHSPISPSINLPTQSSIYPNIYLVLHPINHPSLYPTLPSFLSPSIHPTTDRSILIRNTKSLHDWQHLPAWPGNWNLQAKMTSLFSSKCSWDFFSPLKKKSLTVRENMPMKWQNIGKYKEKIKLTQNPMTQWLSLQTWYLSAFSCT